MIEVGVRELRGNLSRYLRRVARGERMRITMHGRPLADLVPVGPPREDPETLALEAEGKVKLSRVPKDREPPAPVSLRRSASRLILDEREAER